MHMSQMLLISPRNSVDANVNLFTLLDCRNIVTTDPRPPPVKAVLGEYRMRVLTVPPLDDLLDVEHRHFPYEKDYEASKFEPLVVVHTSGSTGKSGGGGGITEVWPFKAHGWKQAYPSQSYTTMTLSQNM
jgi:hypothetical protein